MDTEIKKMLEEILTTVKSIEGRLATAPAAGSNNDNDSSNIPLAKKLSLKEFIISQAPSNAVQTTLTIAYYLENYDGLNPFHAADLEQGFRAAREPVPANINDKANMCVKNGYFMEAKDKKENKKSWVVTRSGEEFVRARFVKVD
jgi:hypothetical protein